MRPGRALRALIAGLVAAVVLTLLAACVSPAVDATGYRGKVGQSALRMKGIVGSARLAVQLDLQGKMIKSVTDTVVTDAENDAQSVLSSFETVQPPDAAMVQLRTAADTVLQDASGNLSDLRIAVRRDDESQKRKLVGELGTSIDDLQQLQDRA